MDTKKELPQRKPLRLRDFNYSAPGLYFITICTHHKKSTLSRVVGAIHESPAIKLTAYGEIVDRNIRALSERFVMEVGSYVIMPNHIHLILALTGDEQIRAIRESPLQGRSEISKIVGYLKMNASKEIRCRFGEETVWQRGFHDHIIRDREDLERHLRYIGENPLYWRSDELYVQE
ncbi:MAG: hypothetical protein E7624_06115 [Ruminococcaceae bacterium]|nr:hypothetical protein [Oscillospiraceae bacterium]